MPHITRRHIPDTKLSAGVRYQTHNPQYPLAMVIDELTIKIYDKVSIRIIHNPFKTGMFHLALPVMEKVQRGHLNGVQSCDRWDGNLHTGLPSHGLP
jgi:hypothetical protein